MNTSDDGLGESGGGRRYPGRYLVYGFVVSGVIVFGIMLVLAMRLSPAADEFHSRTPPAARK